jgi:hypothetical protein
MEFLKKISNHATFLFIGKNAKHFPSLANMAQMFLAVCASSAPCKQAISVG